MGQDSPKELTIRNIDQLEVALNKTGEILQEQFKLNKSPINKYIVSMDAIQNIELTVELSKQSLSTISSQKFLDTWQQQTGKVEGSYAINYTLSEELAGGTAITVSSQNHELSRYIVKKIKQELSKLSGVSDVYDDNQVGKQQLKMILNTRGILLGVKQRQLATLLDGAFGRIEIHRLFEKSKETIVLVTLPDDQKKTITQLKKMPVYLDKNSYVSLGEIAFFEFSREQEVLYRRNQDEVINIYWHQNRSLNSPENVWEKLQKNTILNLKNMYPDVKVEAIGEFSEIGEIQDGFKKAMLLTLLLIYI